jgi:hypothetical protein
MGNQRVFGNIAVQPCAHQFSWPRRSTGGEGYYQTCVLCGDVYGYDWHSMRRLARRPPASAISPIPKIEVRWKPRARRLRVSGPVRYRESGGVFWIEGELKNISNSGVLFVGSSTMPEGTRVDVELDMPPEICGGSTARRVRCAAEIVRSSVGENRHSLAARITDYAFIGDMQQ